MFNDPGNGRILIGITLGLFLLCGVGVRRRLATFRRKIDLFKDSGQWRNKAKPAGATGG
jgi:hypothetical protein